MRDEDEDEDEDEVGDEDGSEGVILSCFKKPLDLSLFLSSSSLNRCWND